MNKEEDFYFYGRTADRKAHFKKEEPLARISYLRAIKVCPDKGGLNLKFAKFLGNIQQYKSAEFRYRKASIFEPKFASLYNEWGLLLDKQGKLEGQEELYRKALEVNPNLVEAMCNLGAVLTEKCHYDEGIKYLEQALQQNSRNHAFINNLGCIYLTIGKYEKAIEYFNKSIECCKGYYLPCMNLALTLMCLGKDEDAKENYEKGREFMQETSGKKEWLIREFKKLFDITKQKLPKEETDEEKLSHNIRLISGLEEIIGLLEKESFS